MKRIIPNAIALLGLAVLIWAGCAPPAPSGKTDRKDADKPAAEQKDAPSSNPPPPVYPVAESLPKPKPAPAGLQERIEAAIESVQKRDLVTSNAFWTVFHGILGLGFDTTLLDPATGKRVRAIDWICEGRELRGLRFVPTPTGVDVHMGPPFAEGVGQGHQDQFIAEMCQWGMKADQQFKIDGKTFTMMDFVKKSQARIDKDQELEWAIIVIAQYVGTGADVIWPTEKGEVIDFATVMKYVVDEDKPIKMSPCGGTHRLFGLAWAYHVHVQRGNKVEGVWKDVVARLNFYKAETKRLQNPDFSFSTNYYRGWGKAKELETRISTTGHTLEWLSLAMTDEELRQDWVQKAAEKLADMILEVQSKPNESGGLYHAVHGLKLYHARMFTPQLVGTSAIPIPPPPKDATPAPTTGTRDSLLPKK